MRIIYGVEYIEVEFGERPFGWRLYRDFDRCQAETKEASKKGYSHGQYIGPRRPLEATEIPFESLDENAKDWVDKGGVYVTDDNWYPQFKGKRHYIS